MKTTLKFTGGLELSRRLNQLPLELSQRVRLEALKTAAEPIRAHAASLAPRDEHADSPHLADNIVIGAVSERKLEARGREGETVVEVGPAQKPSDHFYGYFQEYGTAHHPAQPFMRPAFDAEAGKSLDVLSDELWWNLKHGVDKF